MRGLSLVLLCATACAAAPPSGPTTPCASPPVTAIAPPPAIAPDRLAFWRGVKAADYRVPDGATAESLLPELTGFLASPDPDVRDGIGYEVLDAWISRPPVLAPPALRALASTLMTNLAPPHDAAPDAVFRRSFSALVLASITARDLETPFLSPDELGAMVAAARRYAAIEADLRGHVGAQGWAHASAHTADWLDRLARHPGLVRGDAIAILAAVGDLAVRRHGHNLHHGEDSRLAAPVMSLLRRDLIDRDALAPWVDGLLAPFREKGDFDPARYAAQRNGRNLLFTLFVFLSLEDAPSASVKMALPVVRAAIAS